MVLTFANVVTVCGNFAVRQRLLAMQTVTNASLTDIITILVICLVALLIGLVATLWAVGVWTVRLTTFARAYKLYGPECTLEQFKTASIETESRKSYLARFWLLTSGYLMVPLIAFACLLAVRIFTGPEWTVNGQALVPLPAELSLPIFGPLLIAGGLVLLLVIYGYSCVSICFASLSPRSPFKTATTSLQQCLVNPLPVLVITLVVGLLNMFLTSPLSAIAMITDPHLLDRELWFAIATQVWLGVTSTVVWTASISPFCMITSVPTTSLNHDQQ